MSIYSNHNNPEIQQLDNPTNQQSSSQDQNVFLIYSFVQTNNKIKYWRNPKIYNHLILIFLFLVECSHFPRLVQCDCAQSPLIQTMFIEKNLYCSMKFDPCSNNKLVKCMRLFCVDTLQKCYIQTSMSSAVSCQDLCCLGSSDSFNVNNTNSLQLCNSNLNSGSQSGSSNTQQTSFVGGYILIAVFASAFVLILIGFCLCKRYRSEQISAQNQMNQNLNNQGNNFPSTCVDLKAYDINTQGPYFVNSNDACAICLDKEVNLRTHCNHFYHGNCLLAWLKKKPNNPCPLCMGTTYNPIKVYCQQCHCGDILVNIQPVSTLEQIKAYDTHKCPNCKGLAISSFTFSDEDNKKKTNEMKTQNTQKFNLNEINDKKFENKIKHQQSLVHKSRRKQRKVQSLRKVSFDSQKIGEFQQREQIDTSAKKFHPNHNKTSIGP